MARNLQPCGVALLEVKSRSSPPSWQLVTGMNPPRKQGVRELVDLESEKKKNKNKN